MSKIIEERYAFLKNFCSAEIRKWQIEQCRNILNIKANCTKKVYREALVGWLQNNYGETVRFMPFVSTASLERKFAKHMEV